MKETRDRWIARLSFVEMFVSIAMLLSGVTALVQVARIYHWIFVVLFILMLSTTLGDITKVVLQSANKDGSLSLDQWDRVAKNLRDRYGKTTYWIGWSAAIALVATMWHVGFYFLAVLFFVKCCMFEVLMHRLDIYMNDEDNKIKWGAASYMHEVKKKIEEVAKEDKMKGFYKDI